MLPLVLTAFLMISPARAASRYPAEEGASFGRSSKETATPKRRKQESAPPSTPFAPGTHNLSVGVGQVFLMGDLSNHYDNAIGPEVHYTYGVSDLFSFQSNFGYHSHSAGTLSIWNLSGGLRANLMYFDQLVPFATVGMGFYSPTYTYANGSTVNSLLFGMQMGTGIDLLISNAVFFGAKLNYNTMFSSTKKASDGTTQSLGGSYLSFMIHAGMTF
ncbi:MAG: hypothetical protein EBX52_00615 [Proteobacteria bacterium]|nr:hypothetical protein [Pseudomonadota bacterium]